MYVYSSIVLGIANNGSAISCWQTLRIFTRVVRNQAEKYGKMGVKKEPEVQIKWTEPDNELNHIDSCLHWPRLPISWIPEPFGRHSYHDEAWQRYEYKAQKHFLVVTHFWSDAGRVTKIISPTNTVFWFDEFVTSWNLLTNLPAVRNPRLPRPRIPSNCPRMESCCARMGVIDASQKVQEPNDLKSIGCFISIWGPMQKARYYQFLVATTG